MTKSSTETAASTTSTNSTRIYLEDATEPAMELENWMTNENTFSIFNFNFENDVEIPLAVENWMLEPTNFGDDNLQEEKLELQSWMTSAEVWGV
jgi:hypothetical protein